MITNQKTRFKKCYASFLQEINFQGQLSMYRFETKQSVLFFLLLNILSDMSKKEKRLLTYLLKFLTVTLYIV